MIELIFGAAVTVVAGLAGYFLKWLEETDSSATPSLESND